MIKSEQINEIAAALSKAQANIKGAIKDSSNPFFKSKYADLESVIGCSREALSDNNLSFVQLTRVDGDKITLETMLMHSSGQFIVSEYPIITQKTDSQSIGSAITYARRYSLTAMLGIPQVDDDGNAASDKSVANEPRKATNVTTPKPATSATSATPAIELYNSTKSQKDTLMQLFTKHGLNAQADGDFMRIIAEQIVSQPMNQIEAFITPKIAEYIKQRNNS